MKWEYSPELVEFADLCPPAPYGGIIAEGAEYPAFWAFKWDYCRKCACLTGTKRVTESYDFHIEHVRLDCVACETPIMRFDVITEANLSRSQLPAAT